MTSERGLVFLVDHEAQRLVAKMDDGREQVFERDEIGATQLAHGYATTVHRSQGATTGRAHVYEDGGGRELAYVAMSRAKEHTHVYVAADDLDVAREDLARLAARAALEVGHRHRRRTDSEQLDPDQRPGSRRQGSRP